MGTRLVGGGVAKALHLPTSQEETRLARSGIDQRHFERKRGNSPRFLHHFDSNQASALTIRSPIPVSMSQAVQSSKNEEVDGKQFDEVDEISAEDKQNGVSSCSSSLLYRLPSLLDRSHHSMERREGE